MNLVLIGYRATGKSSVGALLSKQLHWPLLDTDDLIQQEARQTIPEIVAAGGWDHFRHLEKMAVARVCSLDHHVIATGGGVVLEPENVARLRATGCLIWLQADAETIQARLAADDNRPSLTGADTIKEVPQVLEKRLAAYRRAAHINIDTSGLSPAQIAERILRLLPEPGCGVKT
ncbi:MAG: shikimate kinase [Deltaproteobacteria bacterium]|nr:shikimate kinase [Deltaproteobacteria bacterium]MBW2084574.1 shikimate kinase [Deltaproteobacteria bacterium]